MDEYLLPNASLLRLISEYEKYKSLVIAYDYDNTVFDFHKKGCTYLDVIALLRDLKSANCICICFTAAEDHKSIEKYCTDNNIPLDGININPPFFKSSSPKIYYNAYLDDRAGLLQVYSELKLLLTLINKNEN